MPDLKAAAKEMREVVDGSWSGRQSRDACILAAQALEAWAWMAESGWRIEYEAEDYWCCTNEVFTRYYADTPLGAVLAAMKGERSD